MPRPLPARRALLWLAVVSASAGCDAFGRYLSVSPEDRLVPEAVAQWAERGRPFLDGVSGEDTVASVTPTGARGWEVAVAPPGGGLPSVWSFEIPRVEVYPLFAGDAFAAWLDERARVAGLPDGIHPELARAIRAGDIRAVGDLEVRYGPASRSARTTVERVAYLVPRPYSDETEWLVQPAGGAADALLEALKLATDELIHDDPELRGCLGGRAPSGSDREAQLRCLVEVLGRRFGEG